MSARRKPKISKTIPPDPNWIQARRQLLRQMKEQVRRRLGPEPEEIRRYSRRFENGLKRAWSISNKADLMVAVEAADIIYGGDFHAFGQAQRTHLRILKALPLSSRPLLLALEAIDVRHQKHLDAYIEGQIDERALLRKTRWQAEWGFPFEHYRPLLEFARERGHRILALGCSRRGASLAEREDIAAKAIVSALRLSRTTERPRLYVVFGELHLVRRHLPARVRAVLGKGVKDVKDLTIHLNSERLYFELAELGLETSVDVVTLSPNIFCVLSSPPWVQWQSYLLFLEEAHDTDLVAESDDPTTLDYTDQVTSLVRLAAKDLGLEFKCDDIAVFSAGDARLWSNLKSALSARDLQAARCLLESGRSFFIPCGGIFFLSNSTVNHAAEMAGQYIHSRFSGRERPLWRLPDDFQALIWIEAIGFFVSKLINHKRHSETLPDLKARLAALAPRDQGREALLIALEQRLGELLLFHRGRRRKARLRPRRSASWLEAARLLGGMMGERLYLAFRSRKISLKTILSLMRTDPTAPGFDAFYEDVVRRLGPGTGALRTRKERL